MVENLSKKIFYQIKILRLENFMLYTKLYRKQRYIDKGIIKQKLILRRPLLKPVFQRYMETEISKQTNSTKKQLHLKICGKTCFCRERERERERERK